MIIDEDFQALMDGFCRANCEVFEATEENKLEYTVSGGLASSAAAVSCGRAVAAIQGGVKRGAVQGGGLCCSELGVRCFSVNSCRTRVCVGRG